jgi:HEAT repeat protein
MVNIVKQTKIKFVLNIFFLLLGSAPLLLQADALILDPDVRLGDYFKPEITVSGVEVVFSESLKPLWMKALKRPEADYQRLAATTITLAHRRGMKGLEDTIPELAKLLNQPDLHPTVKLSVVEALVELNAKEQAEKLAEVAQSDGIYYQAKIEPALAKWNYESYRKIWLERINGTDYPRRIFTLGLQCLAEVKDEKAVARMLEVAKDQNVPEYVRITAGKGLGSIKTSGLIDEAKLIFQSGGLINEYVAISMIKNHEGKDCDNTMRIFGMSSHPIVIKVALNHLLKNEEIPMEKITQNGLASGEPAVRILSVKALNRFESEKKMNDLFKMFEDVSYDVRRAARSVLLVYSEKEEFKDPIIKRCRELILSKNWREVEQAMLLLVRLDDKQSATQFVKLLRHDRAEVAVTAAWGLRKFKVFATLPALGEELVKMAKTPGTIVAKYSQENKKARELKAAQLIIFIGELNFPFPQEQLIPLIQFKVLGDESRAAAIWTLGELNRGKQPENIVNALIDRVTDTKGNNPEDVRIRRMSAISLGKMKSKKAIPALREYYLEGRPNYSTAAWACGWALEQITGEKMVPIKDKEEPWNDWFLKPISKF